MIRRTLGLLDRWMRPRLLVLQVAAWGALFGLAVEAGDWIMAALTGLILALFVQTEPRP